MEKTTDREERMFHFSMEVRMDEQNGTVIEGVPIVFGQEADLGDFREIISPMALTNADMRDIALFVNHDMSMIPLARSRNNNENSTMQFTVQPDGVHMRANIDTENPTGKELMSAIKRGDIDGMSFAFSVSSESWTDVESVKPLRTINAFDRIFEVSAVTYPAYKQTSISARSLASLESEKKALESARAKEARRQEINNRLEALRNDKRAE